MFAFQPFSKKQMQLMNWYKEGAPTAGMDMVVADGSIRAGKTIAMTAGFLQWAQENHEGKDFILAGKTVGSLKRNVITPLLGMLDSWGWGWEYNRSGVPCIRVGTNSFYLFGASSEAAQDTLQGMTAAGALADEVALFPKSFVEQMIGRCSVEGALIWMNCNPRGPFHYFKTDFIDKAEEKRIAYFHFTMGDNLTLAAAVVERYCRMFSGMFYERYIKGKWVQAEGVIFDMFDERRHVMRGIPTSGGKHYISCDYGTQNPCVFLLWGEQAGGVWACEKEYYYGGREVGRQKTDEEYCDDLEEFAGSLNIQDVIIDPNATSFIAAVRKRRRFHVRKGKNAVAVGIRNTATALTTGMLLFDASCTNTIKEFHSYVWSDKAFERGEDAPLKQSDHAMDATRYFVNTIVASPVSLLR